MERVILNKANYLADVFGYEVILITTDQKDGKSFYPFSKSIRHIDLNINYMDIARKKGFFQVYLLYRIALIKHRKALTTVLMEEKADIVVSLSRDEKEFLYKINDGSKKVLESHRCLKPRAPIEFRRAKSIIQKIKIVYRLLHETRLPKYYDKFIVLTEEDKTFWSEKNNVVVIPNPLPFETPEKPDLSAKRVLCVGRISTDKGIDRLLSIWSKVSVNYPDWKLSLIGDVVDSELLKQIKDLNLEKSVEIIAATRNIQEEYLKSSVYVMTSRFEGLPMVLLEAISVGLPVVSYTFKCGPRDVINDEVDGFLVEEDDEPNFVERLGLLLGDQKLRETMSKNAKINSERFSVETVMNKWDKLFLELINN